MEATSNMLEKIKGFFQGRRGRDLKEALFGYALAGPALLLIFTFGIFPILFAVYVSFHRWKIKQGDYLGLANFVKAVDNLAYLLFFALALGLAFLTWRIYKQLRENLAEQDGRNWFLLLPGALHAGSGLLFLRWFVLLLPQVLAIADQLRGVRNEDRTPALYRQLFSDAFHVDQVFAAFQQWIWVWLAAWVVLLALWLIFRIVNLTGLINKFISLWFFGSSSVIVVLFTVTEIQKAIIAAQETGEEVHIWVQILSISAGALLLIGGWKLWNAAIIQLSDRAFVWRLLAALFLIVGGMTLIIAVPPVIQAGDEDLWQGLRVTVYYSLGTIPFQLSISLVLAFLLFQNIRGKEFFRILFFLPYVTPAVASAAVFRLLFSNNPNAFINGVITNFGGEAQRWLIQPRGIFTIIAQAVGIENWPEFLAGPSQALVVVIIYSIWVFVGYDVVIFLAGLGNISNEVNEAAAIDGASRWQIMRHITLPLLSPTIYFLSLIAVIGTFKAFNHIYILRDALALGTLDTFSVAIFDEFFQRTRFGYASAMAFVLFAVILALTYANNKIQGSRVFYG